MLVQRFFNPLYTYWRGFPHMLQADWIYVIEFTFYGYHDMEDLGPWNETLRPVE